MEALPAIAQGGAVWTEQDEGRATHAPKIEKAELWLSPADTALVNGRRVRASTDAAPARCALGSHPARVLRVAPAGPEEGAGHLRPAAGEWCLEQGRLLLGCADGVLPVLELKPDGKRAMDARAWAAGQRLAEGTWERLP